MGCRSPHVKRQFRGRKGPAQDMPGHVRRSIYSKRLSRGQHRYGADDDLGCTELGENWRYLHGKYVCGGDAASCQITLTTCCCCCCCCCIAFTDIHMKMPLNYVFASLDITVMPQQCCDGRPWLRKLFKSTKLAYMLNYRPNCVGNSNRHFQK